VKNKIPGGAKCPSGIPVFYLFPFFLAIGANTSQMECSLLVLIAEDQCYYRYHQNDDS